jgi:superfamily II DNA or RNA helicase
MESKEVIAQKIIQLLEETPFLTARQVSDALDSPDVDKSIVNSVMYLDEKKRFLKDESPRPQWSLNPQTYQHESKSKSSESGSNPSDVSTGMESSDKYGVAGLREWQIEALSAWEDAGCRGIVEAVTGAGKTRLAMAAIARELNLGGKVAVIVPSRELQRQWEREMHVYFGSADIGLLGNGNSDSLLENDILIAVVNSASQNDLGLLGGELGLLIADECHRLGAEKFQLALEEGFASRLGLSATRERADGAHETILAPYFGDVVYTIGYEEAIAGGYISGVKVALIEVEFSDFEKTEFDEYSTAISESQLELTRKFGIAIEPYSRFMEEVNQLAMFGDRREGIAAKRYISAVNKRRKLLANTPRKIEVLSFLISSIKNSNRTIIFTETISGVEEIHALLIRKGVKAERLHSGLSASERVGALHRFETGLSQAMVAARVLDEGIDVPEADLAVIISATKTRRQMIQRMGRVIRPKKDGRPARFVLVYVVGTSEDPSSGAHDAFFDEIIKISKESETFKYDLDDIELTNFLRP